MRERLIAATFGVIFHFHNVALSYLLFIRFRSQSSKALLLLFFFLLLLTITITPTTPESN